MTWSPLTAQADIISCERPFSFFFGLIKPFWRTGDVHNAPLHRLATLARKQGAKALIVENALDQTDIIDELNGVDAHFGGGGAAEALRLSFLSEMPTGKDIASVGPDCLIGQCILINYRPKAKKKFALSYVFEALFSTPRLPGARALLNNFINTEATFDTIVWGRRFSLQGICYAQQNGVTSVCAHASIRMVEQTLFPNRRATSAEVINEMLEGSLSSTGMNPSEIAVLLEKLTGHEVADINCANLDPHKYVSILTAAADSGEIALLIFKTGAQPSLSNNSPAPQGPVEHHTVRASTNDIGDQGVGDKHVVVVLGYTRNSDEWHPLAIPEYSGLPSSKYRASSMWVDHFVIHDDNFGPYLTLSTRALERDPTVSADHILIVRRAACNLSADTAEASASHWLAMFLPKFKTGGESNTWLDFIIAYKGKFVLRPVLITRQEYFDHLYALEGYDGSRITEKIGSVLVGLPELLWMVEFSLSDLFTGNRTKLGEVLVDANWPVSEKIDGKSIIGARLPGQLVLADRVTAPFAPKDPAERYAATLGAVSLVSHSPMFMRTDLAPLW